MAEKVARTGVKREKDFMYYIKNGAVWKVPRKQPGVAKGKPEKVVDAGVTQDFNYIYFLDKDGDVARAKRAVGGQKRKKTKGSAAPKRAAAKKPAARKKAPAAKKSAPKKAAKKAPAKKGKKR